MLPDTLGHDRAEGVKSEAPAQTCSEDDSTAQTGKFYKAAPINFLHSYSPELEVTDSAEYPLIAIPRGLQKYSRGLLQSRVRGQWRWFMRLREFTDAWLCCFRRIAQ